MKAIAAAALAAIVVTASTPSFAAGTPKPSSSKPSSFAPQPHSNRRAFGAPIQPPILGHRKSAHHKQGEKKQKKAPASAAGELPKQPARGK